MPPTRLFDDVIRMPATVLLWNLNCEGSAVKNRPVIGSGNAPTKSPQTQLPCAVAPEIETPTPLKPVTTRPSTTQLAAWMSRPLYPTPGTPAPSAWPSIRTVGLLTSASVTLGPLITEPFCV